MRRRLTAEWMILGVIFLAPGVVPAGSPAAARVELAEQARVPALRYSLGEIATIDAADPVLARRLSELPMGVAPRVGYRERAERARLEARVERLLPAYREEIVWTGAEAVEVEVAARVLSSVTYGDVAKRFLRAWLGERHGEFHIALRDRLEDLRLPEGELELMPRLGNGDAISSRMSVWVDVSIRGEHYRSIPVWFEVAVYEDVVVATDPLVPGEILDATGLVLERRDIAAIRGRTLGAQSQLSGLRLREYVGSGEALRAEVLEAVPDVARGAQVAVTSRVGNVAVIVLAEALEDGYVGDRVKVRRGAVGESFAVRVTGEASAVADGSGVGRRYD